MRDWTLVGIKNHANYSIILAFNLLTNLKNKVSYLIKFQRPEKYFLLVWNLYALENILCCLFIVYIKIHKWIFVEHLLPSRHCIRDYMYKKMNKNGHSSQGVHNLVGTGNINIIKENIYWAITMSQALY